MPATATATETATAVSGHNELNCADVEALLAESEATNTELRADLAAAEAENADLHRRLQNALNAKTQAVDEAVMLRSRPTE